MPWSNCAEVSRPVGSTLTRTTAVRMWASLSPSTREPGRPTASRAIQRSKAGELADGNHCRIDYYRRSLARNSAPRLLLDHPTWRRAERTASPTAKRAATVRLKMPTRCSATSNAAGCSAAAVRAFRWRRSCGPCATTGSASAPAPSSSRTARRESRLRSRTVGCCATGRTSFWTGCGWRPPSSGQTVLTSTCPTLSRPAASKPRSANLMPARWAASTSP